MGLSSREEETWDRAILDFYDQTIDPIELAVLHPLIQKAARFLIRGEPSDVDLDWSELTVQIGGDFDLNPDEIVAAMEIAESRLPNV